MALAGAAAVGADADDQRDCSSGTGAAYDD